MLPSTCAMIGFSIDAITSCIRTMPENVCQMWAGSLWWSCQSAAVVVLRRVAAVIRAAAVEHDHPNVVVGTQRVEQIRQRQSAGDLFRSLRFLGPELFAAAGPDGSQLPRAFDAEVRALQAVDHAVLITISAVVIGRGRKPNLVAVSSSG